MKAREFDARRLPVKAFAKDASELQGQWPLDGFERLRDVLAPTGETATAPVSWSAQGEERAVRGGASQTWLHLQARATLSLVCQRCLQPSEHVVELDRHFRFARDEAEAARLDDEIDDDVLVLARELDLHELIEDELLLDLPLVPRHADCSAPMPADGPAAPAGAAGENPFAALATLRRPSG
jgi:uncharacterized protein